MKIIEIDEDLYQYIATQAQSADESSSDILRRLLLSSPAQTAQNVSPEPEEFPHQEIGLATNDDEPKSAVENSPVLEEFSEETVESEVPEGEEEIDQLEQRDFEQPVSVHLPQQSEAVIQQTVNKVRQLLNSAEFQQESTAVSRFLALFKVLYQNNADSFAQATEQEAFQGRSRTYFARDEATLLAAGNHTKPKQIPDTPYWVITNNNSARKMLMLERIMQFMQLPESLINEVRTYFTAD